MGNLSKQDLYRRLDAGRTRRFESHAALAPVLDYMRDHYPVQYDKFSTLLAECRQQLADEILHRTMLKADADQRQTTLDLHEA